MYMDGYHLRRCVHRESIIGKSFRRDAFWVKDIRERETFDAYMIMYMCVHTSTRVGTWPLLVPSVGRGWH